MNSLGLISILFLVKTEVIEEQLRWQIYLVPIKTDKIKYLNIYLGQWRINVVQI